MVIDMTNIMVASKDILRERDPRFTVRFAAAGAEDDAALSREVNEAFWDVFNISRFIKHIESASWSPDWTGKIGTRLMATGKSNIPLDKVDEFKVGHIQMIYSVCAKSSVSTGRRLSGIASAAHKEGW